MKQERFFPEFWVQVQAAEEKLLEMRRGESAKTLQKFKAPGDRDECVLLPHGHALLICVLAREKLGTE